MTVDLAYTGTSEETDRLEAIIRDAFPDAKFAREYDFIHEWRLEVHVPDEDAFYIHAIQNKYALDLLGFQLGMEIKPEWIKRLMRMAGVSVPPSRSNAKGTE